MRKNLFGAALLISVAIIFLSVVYIKDSPKNEHIPYVMFLEQAEQGNIAEVTISDSAKLKYKLKNSATEYVTDNPRSITLKEQLLKNGIAVTEGGNVTVGSVAQMIFSILLFAGVLFYMYRTNQGAPQGAKSAMALNPNDYTQSDKKQLSFSDVAGNEEAKESVSDLVDFIKNPEKYARYGARMPRGVIFYGPPGTGKTLMAKAIAGEAEVPFYAVSGSDFVQMYVGVGAGRIRELFKKARENGKAVIFIDEIDALGKKRSASAASGNDERDQTLNALLTEMSGFSSRDGIVVIAATNRLDTLDEALLRPGRFDRQIEIGLPDLNARKTIIAHHAQNKPLSKAVNTERLANQTVYFSGAMLENLLNEAAIFAAKTGSDEITPDDIEKAYYTVIAGSERKDRSGVNESERRITAYHEAGHALITKLFMPQNSVSKITIIPSTKGIGGFCVNIAPDKMFYTKKELESQIMVSLAGRAAEEIIFGAENVTTGAYNDIEKATGILKDYVMKYGMGLKHGMLNVSLFNDTNAVINECGELMESLYAAAKKTITEHIGKLTGIAEELLDKETLHEEDLDRLISA